LKPQAGEAEAEKPEEREEEEKAESEEARFLLNLGLRHREPAGRGSIHFTGTATLGRKLK